MNKIYLEMYQNKLFTLAEAGKVIRNYQVCRNSINRLVKSKNITRLRSGLYYINPLDNEEFYPDPIHIASKLRKEAVICANSALEVFKLLDKDDPTIYLSSNNPGKIRIDRNTYRILKEPNFGIDKTAYATDYGTFTIKITDPERTILDCLKTRSIRGEELIRILKQRKMPISMRKIINYLEKYNMPILYNKIGLILESCKQELKIDLSDLEKIRRRLTKKINYFKEKDIKLIRPKYKYYKEWNIMIQEPLFEIVKPNNIQESMPNNDTFK